MNPVINLWKEESKEQFGYVMAFNTFWAVPSGRIQIQNEWSAVAQGRAAAEACCNLSSVFKEFAQVAVLTSPKWRW